MDAAKGADDPVVPKWVPYFSSILSHPWGGSFSGAEGERADLGDFRLNFVGFSSMPRTSRHCRMVSRWKL